MSRQRRATFAALLDQGLSSLQNFVVVVLVARFGGAEEFGAFVVAYLLYTLALQAGQALVGEPFTLLIAEVDNRPSMRGAVGSSAAVGAVLGVPMVAVGFLISAPVGRYLLLVGSMLPALLVLDGLRLIAFARLRPAVALLLDSTWVASSAAALLGCLVIGQPVTPVVLVLAWAVPGAAVGTGALLFLRLVPTWSLTAAFARTSRELAPRLLGEAVLMNGGLYAVSLAVGLVSGVAELGILRAAQTLFGPLNTVTSAMRVAALPLLVRTSPHLLRRRAFGVSALVALVSLCWALPLLRNVGGCGELLLGRDVWRSAAPLVVPLGIQYVVLAGNLSAFLGLRALRDLRRSGRARLRMTVLIVIGGTAGALVGGATGAAWFFCVAVVLGTADWHLQFRSSVHAVIARKAVDAREPDATADRTNRADSSAAQIPEIRRPDAPVPAAP